jgi:creatinine amidohydrolase
MSWPDFTRLPAGRVIAVLPLGALEAHGPHLPLGTDIVIAEAMAREGANRLAARGMDVVVLPALPVSPAPFAGAFAGTIDTPPAATTALIVGIAQSLHRHGVRMTALANAHHDPAHVAAIRAAVSEAHDSGQAMLVFPDLTRRHWASRLTDEFQSGACHAGRYEGSVVLAESPDLVDRGRQAKLAPNPSSLVDAIRRGDRSFAQAGGPQAYFGWPADATADEGRRIIETLGAIIEDAVMEAWESAAPSREHSMTERTSVRGLTIVNPVARRRPRGFSHGILAPPGWRPLAIAGQTAADDDGTVVQLEFAAQFDAALVKVVDVVRAAGGEPHHIARMTVYVTDLDVYRASKMLLGDVWKRRMGSHYPAMALIGVSGLVDRLASVEIEADAMLPPSEDFQ